MTTTEEHRRNFILSLRVLDEVSRARLLAIETQDELGELYNLAEAMGCKDVAASIKKTAAQ